MKVSTSSANNRDLRVDILKVIALLLIILAHIKTNDFVFQLRNFDVPLMVLCAGILFCHSMESRETKPTYRVYIEKRVRRLLLPSWAFLFIYFILVYFGCLITKELYPYTWMEMLQEFFLRSKIIGLWIIRVFILVAFLAPVLYKFRVQFAKNFSFLILLLIIYGAYESLYYGLSKIIPILPMKIMENSLFEMIPYACVFALGMMLAELKKSSILIAAISLLAVFAITWCCYSYFGMSLSTQAYKYPPRLFYLSYAVGMSLFLYLLLDDVEIDNSFTLRVIYFISSSSLWIYFWHWFFMRYAHIAIPYTLRKSSFVQYLAVLSFSMIATFLQRKTITEVNNNLQVKGRFGRMVSLNFLK